MFLPVMFIHLNLLQATLAKIAVGSKAQRQNLPIQGCVGVGTVSAVIRPRQSITG